MTECHRYAELFGLFAERWKAHESSAIERLVEGASDEQPGIWIDKLGPLAVVSVYDSLRAAALPLPGEWLSSLGQRGPEHLILKLRDEQGGFRYLYSSQDLPRQRFVGFEDDCKFEVRCDPRHDFGVFPDARAARRLVARLARGRRVLNLFAYTCGFGVAAAKHGASLVTNVDASHEMLTWGKRNAELNGVDFAVVPDTAQKYLRRLRERRARGEGTAYDLIILDPPAFGVGRGDERILRKAWPSFLEAVVDLAPQHVLLAFNDLAFRRSESIAALIDRHFDRAWQRHWFDAHGVGIAHPADRATDLDPYFAPPLFLHMQRPTGAL